METDFGTNLRTARKAADMTQRELAKRLDTDNARISDWENGHAEPGAFTIRRIAKALDVSADYLLGLASNHDPDAEHTLRVIRKLVAVNDGSSGGKVSDIGCYRTPTERRAHMTPQGKRATSRLRLVRIAA